MKKSVLSCIQPTGVIHIGNYFGALQNWVNLQETYNCIYGVVDYHAMTMPYDVTKLRNNIWDLIYDLISVGIEPDNLFVQSLVPEHAELCWIFNCFTSHGQAMRMIQFKEKSQQIKESGKEEFVSVGLLDYPVMQAADILIYKADYVPIGKDQEQHLELTRDIAQRFNHQVGKEHFVLPEALFTDLPKVKSTADPSRKMSKSAGEKHNILLSATEERVRKQIRSAVTDTGEEQGGGMSAGVENLFMIMKAAGGQEPYDHHMKLYESGGLRYADLKNDVADVLVAMLKPIQERRKEIYADRKNVKYKIKESSAQIRKRAQETLVEVKDLVGLLNVKY